MRLPRVCTCGNRIQFSNEDRCEDCFAEQAQRYHGKGQQVETHRYHAVDETPETKPWRLK